jgi:hypothetical protein
VEQHVPTGSVYPSDGGETTKNTKITVLTSASGKRATKRFTPEKVEGYARESRWRWREAAISTFNDLARLLAEVERDPLSLIVQGVVAPAWREKEIIPRTKRKGEPSLIDEGSRVIHFDIDDLPLPLGTGWHDPEGVARAVWQTVIVARVPAFDGVSFHWQASSSAGTPGNEHLAKLHIWALLDQPIDEDHRKALLKQAGADDSLASINQPNYVAAPMFDGIPDPLADVGRSGVVVGDLDHAAVDLIAWPKTKIRQAKARKPKQGTGTVVTPEGLDHATTDEGRDLLERHCAQIRGLPQGGRNNAINKIAFTVGGHVAGGSIAYGEAHSALLSAGLASGHDRYVEAVENGLRDGLQRPIAHEEPDQKIKPFHPAPDGDRDAAIAAHPATIRAWADRNIPIMQATKAVARAYAEINDDDDQGLKEKAKAKRAIRRQIRDQFGLDFLPASKITKKAPITRVMLSGAQGVGKTRAVVGADGSPGILHRTQGLISVLFEPDHGKAAEAQRDYDDNAPEGSPPSIHVWGRGSPDPDQPEETMCRLPEIATALSQRGVSVRQALCEECPFQHVCGYLRQEAEIARLADAPEGVAIFAPHDYAFLPLPGFVNPDLAIFDERPRDNGVEDNVGLSFDDLSQTLRFDRPLKAQRAAQTTHEEADAQAMNLRFIRPLQVALRDAGQNHPNRILAALRDRGIDRDHVKGAIAGLTYFQDRETAHAMRDVLKVWDFASQDGRAFNLQSRLDREIEQRDGKAARDLQTIFEALLIEIDKDRDDAIGIGVGDVTRNGQKSKGIVAVKLKRLRLGRVPFLHLDGTGDHGMAKMIFGKMEHAEHRVERSPGGRGDRIVQVVGTDFHNAGLIGGKGKDGKIEPYTGTWADYYDAQRRDIQKIIADGPGALVVGNKRVIEALKPEEYGAHSAHFGAIRGYNTWEEIGTVLIVGREQPSPAAVERIARAYAAHGDADFESLGSNPYPETTRGIRKRDGTGHPVKVAYHPNTWAERVLRSIRDTEIEQAIDRIRPIFKTRAIKIVLLSPVAVDLTVDQVVSWSQFRQGGTRVERALKQARIVPLSGREAARLVPEIWANRTTAQEDLSEARLLAISLNREPYLQILPIRSGVVATYKTEAEAGKRSREHRVLIAAPPEKARAVLEARTGALREFQVVEVFEPDQATVEAAEAREERIAIAMHDGGLSEAEATRVADGIETPEQVEPEDRDRVEIAHVMREHRSLTPFGFHSFNDKRLEDRSDMLSPKRVKEYRAARAFIEAMGTTKTVTTTSPSSYETKHVAERWAGQYISNGMLIVAAIAMGLAIMNPKGSPNAHIGLSRRALSQPRAKRRP